MTRSSVHSCSAVKSTSAEVVNRFEPAGIAALCSRTALARGPFALKRAGIFAVRDLGATPRGPRRMGLWDQTPRRRRPCMAPPR